MGVLLDVRVVRPLGSVLERVQGGHLVAGLDVAVGQLVVRDLAEGVCPVPHHRGVVDGTLEIPGGVEDRSGVEKVIAVHVLVALPDPVVELLCLLCVTLCQIGLRNDPRQMAPALIRSVVIEVQAVLKNVGIVLLHESAIGHVVVGHLLETRIPARLREPLVGLVEIPIGVVDVAQGIPRRRGVVRMGHLVSLLKKGLCLQEVTFLEV